MKWFALLGLLLFLGLSISPLVNALSEEDFEYYITAGVLRKRWGNVGLGYNVVVVNFGESIISGVCYINQTTLTGESITGFPKVYFFNIGHLVEWGANGFTILDYHPINKIEITLKVEDIMLTKSGYEIGPIVVLLD